MSSVLLRLYYCSYSYRPLGGKSFCNIKSGSDNLSHICLPAPGHPQTVTECQLCPFFVFAFCLLVKGSFLIFKIRLVRFANLYIINISYRFNHPMPAVIK